MHIDQSLSAMKTLVEEGLTGRSFVPFTWPSPGVEARGGRDASDRRRVAPEAFARSPAAAPHGNSIAPPTPAYTGEQIADAIARLDDSVFTTRFGMTAHDAANMVRAKLALALPAQLRSGGSNQ